MAFHTYQFVFGVLPACYIGFLLAHKIGGWMTAYRFLAVASVAFYAQFSYLLVAILLTSVVANYVVGEFLMNLGGGRKVAGRVLIAAIAANLAALGYFKYTNFLIETVNAVSGSKIGLLQIIVPVGVSFYTFVQIGYLIEAYNGQVERPGFSRYVLFATFLPCVTAGPLVLQRELLSQMQERDEKAFNTLWLASGLTLFGIGLFKKVILSDAIAPYADQVFNGVGAGGSVAFLTAWVGSLCYALQLYFDFSGYSDMAIGIGCIFGLKLPLNFDSPFKATSISEFWRRWHMTMTRFFTTYIYTSLAVRGMRDALTKRYGRLHRLLVTSAIPAIVTFLVAGIWHGAGWSFVIYGLIHGIAIAINLAWREYECGEFSPPVAWLLTMSVVVSGLVVFRAPDLATAGTILASMWGVSTIFPNASAAADLVTIDIRTALALIMILGSIVLLLPNSQQILHRAWPTSDSMPKDVETQAGLVTWKPNIGNSLAVAVTWCLALTSIGASSTFLYYSF
jgi:D-alanyl-lipoteichoic acid acyltransferase DltB (MBOAT superfamily)